LPEIYLRLNHPLISAYLRRMCFYQPSNLIYNDSSVSLMTKLRAERLGFDSCGATQPPMQWVAGAPFQG